MECIAPWDQWKLNSDKYYRAQIGFKRGPSPAQSAAEKTPGTVITVTRTNAASVRNKWPQSQSRTLDSVAVTEIWLRPEEGNNNLMALDYSFFRMDRADGRIGGETASTVAANYEMQEGHKLHTPNIRGLEVNIETGGPRILSVGVYRSHSKDGELFLFLSVIAGFPRKLPMLGDFIAQYLRDSYGR